LAKPGRHIGRAFTDTFARPNRGTLRPLRTRAPRWNRMSLERALPVLTEHGNLLIVPKPTSVIHDIRVAHGDEGRRLAPLQAQAILDVLTWAAGRQGKPSSPQGA
jgi:hypothetical protein